MARKAQSHGAAIDALPLAAKNLARQRTDRFGGNGARFIGDALIQNIRRNAHLWHLDCGLRCC